MAEEDEAAGVAAAAASVAVAAADEALPEVGASADDLSMADEASAVVLGEVSTADVSAEIFAVSIAVSAGVMVLDSALPGTRILTTATDRTVILTTTRADTDTMGRPPTTTRVRLSEWASWAEVSDVAEDSGAAGVSGAAADGAVSPVEVCSC